MRIRTAVAAARDTGKAVADLEAALRAPDPADGRPFAPSFRLVQATVAHPAEALVAALAAAGVEGPVHGGTSCRGVMTERGFARSRDGAIGALAIEDPAGSYGTGAARIGTDPRAAGRAATVDALAAAGRSGEAPDLVWLTVAPGREEAVLAGIADAVGPDVPVFGGSSADDDVAGGWYQFTGAGAFADAVVVSVLFPSCRTAFDYHSGYQPTAAAGVVTAAEGRRVLSIDGRPAVAVYDGWTGRDSATRAGDRPEVILGEATLHPLGRHVRDVAGVPYYILSHPSVAHPDGALELFSDVAVGDRLVLMSGSPDSLVARAGRVARYALAHGEVSPDRVIGALVVYCGGCLMAVEDRVEEVVAGVNAALGGAPFLGAFTFGEQGCLWDDASRHGNLMISCAAFAD